LDISETQPQLNQKDTQVVTLDNLGANFSVTKKEKTINNSGKAKKLANNLANLEEKILSVKTKVERKVSL